MSITKQLGSIKPKKNNNKSHNVDILNCNEISIIGFVNNAKINI